MKKVKSLLALLLVFVMAVSLTACGNDLKKAEAAVTEALTAIRDCDDETLKEMINVDELGAGMDMGDAMAMFRNVFGGLQFEILSSEQVDENKINVKTKIVAKDMKIVMKNFFQEAITYALEMAFSNPDASEEEITEKMLEILNKCMEDTSVENITTEYDIPVIKGEDGTWSVETSDELINVLSGEMLTAAQELESSLASIAQ